LKIAKLKEIKYQAQMSKKGKGKNDGVRTWGQKDVADTFSEKNRAWEFK
jgi:hypothetical protein